MPRGHRTQPGWAPAYLYLGIALQRQGRYGEAEESIHKALLYAPDSAEAYFNLGLVQEFLGNADEALHSFRRALDCGMDPGQTYHNMSLTQSKEGRRNEALEYGFKALRHAPHSLKYRQNFVHSLRAALPLRVSEDMMSEILRSFETTGVDCKYLMKPGMMLLLQNNHLQQLVSLAVSDEKEQVRTLIVDGYFVELFSIPLLKALLQHTLIASASFESALRMLRAIALDLVTGEMSWQYHGLFDDDDSFAVALASQFFNMEYVVAMGSDEELRVAALKESFGDALQNGVIGDRFLQQLIVLCMYHPLYEQEWVDVLLAIHAPGLTVRLTGSSSRNGWISWRIPDICSK